MTALPLSRASERKARYNQEDAPGEKRLPGDLPARYTNRENRMNREYYICWYCLDAQHRFLIWHTNDKDGVVVDNGKVPTFSSQELLSKYAASHQIRIQPEEPILHGLDTVAQWLAAPSPNSVDCQAFIAAWNLFADVSLSVEGDFDSDKKRTQKIYEKLFCGLNLPPVTPEGKEYEPIWTKKEVGIMSDVLARGFNLFRSSIEEAV
jgi:hypothetical protein